MDKFKLIEIFSNKEVFEKNTQTLYDEDTEYKILQKNFDKKGRRKSFLFRAKRRDENVWYVNFFHEDYHGRRLAAKVYSLECLYDCINS